MVRRSDYLVQKSCCQGS